MNRPLRHRRPVRRVLVPASVAAMLALPATPASAQAPISKTDLNCTITLTVHLFPGVTPRLRTLALTTRGLTGIADCTGTVGADTVTGPGTFALTEAATADCAQSSGRGAFVLRVPAAGRTATVTGTVVSNGSALTGDITGDGVVTGVEGDCVTTPLTSVTAIDTVHIGR